MLLTSILLGLAICAAWLPDFQMTRLIRVPPWAVLLAAATAAGLATGMLDWRGAAIVMVLCGIAFASVHATNAILRRVLTAATVVLTFALGLNRLPGFQPSVFLEGIQLSPDAYPHLVRA